MSPRTTLMDAAANETQVRPSVRDDGENDGTIGYGPSAYTGAGDAEMAALVPKTLVSAMGQMLTSTGRAGCLTWL